MIPEVPSLVTPTLIECPALSSSSEAGGSGQIDPMTGAPLTNASVSKGIADGRTLTGAPSAAAPTPSQLASTVRPVSLSGIASSPAHS